MAEYLENAVQQVSLGDALIFSSSIPCRRGNIFHEDGTGIFTLRGLTNNYFARYQIICNCNVALPAASTVTPIAIGISVQGENRPTSRAIYVPAAVDTYGNLTSTALITVPKCADFTVAVRYVSAIDDGATTPAPAILVQNANLVINRVA